LEEVVDHSGFKVLLEDDYNSTLVVGIQQGILGQQLRPQPIIILLITD
jgi:hypothetical protein